MTLVQELSNLLGARRTIREFKDVEYALEDLHRIIETLLTRHAIGINEVDTDLTVAETILGDVTAAELDALHDLGNSTLVQTNGSGNLADLSSPTLAEIAYVGGVTSAIQTQLDAKGIQSYFYADKNGSNQTLSGTASELVTWTATNKVDTAGIFNDAGDKIVLDADAYWLIQGVLAYSVNADQDDVRAEIYRDTGSGFGLLKQFRAPAGSTAAKSVPFFYVGPLDEDDEIAIYGRNIDSGSSDSISGTAALTWWSAINLGNP